jgi:hypothetical protein
MGSARTRWLSSAAVAAMACDTASPPLLSQRVDGVVALDGPQVGARVTLRPLEADGREGAAVADTRTNADGAFSLRFSGTPGPYRVVAALADGGQVAATLPMVDHGAALAVRLDAFTTWADALVVGARAAGEAEPMVFATGAVQAHLGFEPTTPTAGDWQPDLLDAAFGALAERAARAAGARPGALPPATLLAALVDDASADAWMDGAGAEGPRTLEISPGRFALDADTLRGMLAAAATDVASSPAWAELEPRDVRALTARLLCSASAVFPPCGAAPAEDATPPLIRIDSPGAGETVSGLVHLAVRATDAESGVRSLSAAFVAPAGTDPALLADLDPAPDALSIDLDTRRIAYPALELRFEAVNGDGAAATQTLRLALDNVPGGVLRGVVFKGAAVGVEVTALPVGPDATLGAPLARGLTDADARFELVLPEYQGPLLLRAAGVPDGTSQYRDEAAPAARLTWPAEQHLDAFVPMFAPQAPAQDVTISPLTDLAVARTWAVVGEQALDAAWAESKALVAAHFDVPEFDTLRPSDVDAPAHMPPTSADRYLLALACLSTQARLLAPALRPESPSTFTPLDLVALYRADLAGDAVLDGRDGDAALGLPENALRGALAAACAHWLTDDAANVTGLRVEDVAGLLNGTLAGDTSGLFDADQPPVPFDASGPEIAEIALTSVEGHVGEAGQRGVVLVTVDAEDPAGVAALGVSLRPERPGALSQVDAAVVAHQVWRLDTTALADGPTTLVVSARDTLGNAAERTAALRIDNHAPLLRLRLNGAAVGAGAEVHTAADETVVEVEADEASDVTIALDDVPWLTRAVAPGAPLSVSAPWAVEGPARISVWGADALGNRAEALEVVVVHDASPPVLEVEPTTYVDERQLNRWPLPDDLAAAGLPRTTLDAEALASEQGVTIARQVHRWSNDTEPANPVALRLRVADAFTAPDALEVTWRRAPGQCFLLDDPQAPTRPLLTEAQPVPATEAGFELPLTAETFGFDPMSLGDAAQGRFCVEVIARDAAGNASTRTFGFQTLRVAPAVGFDRADPRNLRGPRLVDIDASTLGALLAGPDGEPVAVAGYTAHNPYPEIPLSVEFRLPPPTIEVFREPVEQWTGPFFAGFTPPECWRALDPRLDEPRTWAFLLATGDGWSCEPMATLGGPAEALPAAFGLALGAAPYAAETLVELRRGPLAPPTELTIGLWPATPDARVANLRSPRPVPELFGYPYAAVVQGPGRIAAIVLDCVQPPCDAWFEATRGERLGRVTTRLEAAQWRAVVRYGREVELNLEVGGVVERSIELGL